MSAPTWGLARHVEHGVRAVALIEKGGLDGRRRGALADRLGVASGTPAALPAAPRGLSDRGAQTRRVLLAKHLIHDTRLPMASRAARGLGSVRRFNETFQQLFAGRQHAAPRGAPVSAGRAAR